METTNEQKNLETPDEKSASMNLAKRGFNRVAVICIFGFAILVAIITFWGIHSRSVSDAALANEARVAAIPSVDVVHPSRGPRPTKSYCQPASRVSSIVQSTREPAAISCIGMPISAAM